jgi:hypothetical protein
MPMFSKMAFAQPGKGLYFINRFIKMQLEMKQEYFEIIFVPLNFTFIEVLVWYNRKASKVLADKKIISEILVFKYTLFHFRWFAAGKYVDRSWEYTNRSQSQTHECGNWDWGCAIPFLGIRKWNFIAIKSTLSKTSSGWLNHAFNTLTKVLMKLSPIVINQLVV